MKSQFQFDEEVLYMNKSISRIIGVIMLIVAFVFIMFALNHPEKSFPWNNTITWLLYGVYFLVTVVLLIAPKMKKWEIPVYWEVAENEKSGLSVFVHSKSIRFKWKIHKATERIIEEQKEQSEDS